MTKLCDTSGNKAAEFSTGLEAVMTQSVFGHEYALMGLEKNIPYSAKETLLARMEKHKKAYFWARQKLAKIDPEKVYLIEENLRFQRETVLRNFRTILH